jgi:hypothetical protein
MSRIDMLIVGLCLVFGYGIVTWWLSLKQPDATVADSGNTFPADLSRDAPVAVDAPSGQPWWQVLGVLEEASWPQIEQAYQAKLRQYAMTHEDGVGSALVALAEQQTRLIEAAYRQAQKARSTLIGSAVRTPPDA